MGGRLIRWTNAYHSELFLALRAVFEVADRGFRKIALPHLGQGGVRIFILVLVVVVVSFLSLLRLRLGFLLLLGFSLLLGLLCRLGLLTPLRGWLLILRLVQVVGGVAIDRLPYNSGLRADRRGG